MNGPKSKTSFSERRAEAGLTNKDYQSQTTSEVIWKSNKEPSSKMLHKSRTSSTMYASLELSLPNLLVMLLYSFRRMASTERTNQLETI